MRGDYEQVPKRGVCDNRAIPTCVGTTWEGELPKGEVLRAIPTCVGTTKKGSRRAKGASGHPHMRGDYNCWSYAKREACGPSPHAWGLRYTSGQNPRKVRAIPTCVGTTCKMITSGFNALGPSPHAWGLLGHLAF